MALSRQDHVRLQLEELQNLKEHLRDYNGSRVARLRQGPAEPEEAGDEEYGAEHVDAAEDGDAQADERETPCPECGEERPENGEPCPHCGAAAEQEAGGEEGGEATDDGDEDDNEASDADRVAELAKHRMHRR